uniref:Uncharacterized protein n=1 Tax=Picea sitchensis TaxID=3332 RepID=A0A6B9XVJ5_PICSI|nr:hypothetical protein Q903MT_gene4235 [Picea sitchensis]
MCNRFTRFNHSPFTTRLRCALDERIYGHLLENKIWVRQLPEGCTGISVQIPIGFTMFLQ